MGLIIVSFTIKDVRDKNGYLESLGMPRITQVKRDADIATAEAEKETRIKVAILIRAWLLLLADTIERNILEPEGIPAGIMIALIGAPYFMYLLMKK
ncbi:putative siderophore transport system permease protein YfhA [Peribacillus sp. Bi134]|nr:putative siderophore transport system permease protein YfhA [Peribacillus sp. Bi134]